MEKGGRMGGGAGSVPDIRDYNDTADKMRGRQRNRGKERVGEGGREGERQREGEGEREYLSHLPSAQLLS